MSLTRRGLFKGAAATGATLATGGAGKAVQGAVVAAGGVASGGAAVSKVVETMASIARTGFPHDEIFNILGNIRCNSPNKSEDSDYLLPSLGNLNEQGDFRRHKNTGEGYDGKIDYYLESEVWKNLKKFPQDRPIMDVLSDEVLERLSDPCGDRAVRGDLESNIKYARILREKIAPFCGETTTAADLTERMDAYFTRMARHLIENPYDVYSTGYATGVKYPNSAEDMTGSTKISEVLSILKENGCSDDGLMQGLELAQERVQQELKHSQLKKAQSDYLAKASEHEKDASRGKKNVRI